MARKSGCRPRRSAQLSAQHRFREITAFPCQQAAEKYLKAFLVRHQVEFPNTHDIARLIDRVAIADPSLAELLKSAAGRAPEWHLFYCNFMGGFGYRPRPVPGGEQVTDVAENRNDSDGVARISSTPAVYVMEW
jgi:hypothetical protein